MTQHQIESVRRQVRVTSATRRANCIGSPGQCYGGNCVHSSGCGSCARVGQSCHECICAEILGTFELAGKVTHKLLSNARRMSAKAQAEYDRRFYWVKGLIIEKCCALRMEALGLRAGDAIELIDGEKATDGRMKRLARRVRLHTGSLLIYRASEGISFEVPYRVAQQ